MRAAPVRPSRSPRCPSWNDSRRARSPLPPPSQTSSCSRSPPGAGRWARPRGACSSSSRGRTTRGCSNPSSPCRSGARGLIGRCAGRCACSATSCRRGTRGGRAWRPGRRVLGTCARASRPASASSSSSLRRAATLHLPITAKSWAGKGRLDRGKRPGVGRMGACGTLSQRICCAASQDSSIPRCRRWWGWCSGASQRAGGAARRPGSLRAWCTSSPPGPTPRSTPTPR
mmetsp:Transcript_16106/g.38822  ORF Transcript_16106/g.38822 Transcript_16106/m.38822 type:complete len:229 (+) Transcript_16106:532-1218(+)